METRPTPPCNLAQPHPPAENGGGLQMSNHVFTSISAPKAAALIDATKHRVVLAAPAVRSKTADAIIRALNRLNHRAVTVIVDCDEEVFRLGYGEIEAIKRIRESGCDIRQCAGLRLGVLVCDERAWVFAPTALYVQPEVHSDETPNAVELRAADVERIVWRLSPTLRAAATIECDDREIASDRDGIESIEAPQLPEGLEEDLASAETEIGEVPVSEEILEKTTESLAIAPPIPFEVARQVRVFTAYIQYVDIRLTGCAIERRRIEIPKSIQGLGALTEITRRLRTTFDLIERASVVSSKTLENELRRLRDDLTHSLGKPWGRVILRAVRPKFDERVKEFYGKLDEHKRRLASELAKQLEESRAQVVEYYLPHVKKSPPDVLIGQLMTQSPNEDLLRQWLDSELQEVFPFPEELIAGMRLEIQFRDVTYETLKDKGFSAALRKAYPLVNWDKPFEEFTAARGRGHVLGNEV